MNRTIDFYFDYYSPYSYFVATKLSQIERDLDVNFEWKPVDIVSILHLDEGDCYNPIKRTYVNQDVIHAAEFHDAPIAMPDPWPLSSRRALAVSLHLPDNDHRRDFGQKVFAAAWARSLDISDPEVLEQCFVETGANIETFATALAQSNTQSALTETATTKALEQGVFGVPFFNWHGKKLFGADRLPMLEAWLQQ